MSLHLDDLHNLSALQTQYWYPKQTNKKQTRKIPPHATFLFHVLQYMYEQIPFMVNNPSVDVAVQMLKKHDAQRILVM